jgi:cytochrome c-type biogenesis protein CcmH/NrfG
MAHSIIDLNAAAAMVWRHVEDGVVEKSGCLGKFPRVSQSDTLATTLIEQEKRSEAIQVLKLNAQLYPDSANAFDSLGEAYEAIEEKTLAIDSYKRALALDPGNKNAATRLSELGKVGQ